MRRAGTKRLPTGNGRLITVREYVDFDLAIEEDDGRYVARVLDSPSGQASESFELPFTPDGIENFVLKMAPTRGTVRRIGSPRMVAAQTFGTQLYDAVFAGEVGTCFRRSVDEADRQGKGLRVRVRLGRAPALTDLPWECLYSEGLGRFVVVSTDTPLVRFLDLPAPVRPLKVTPPLRVLVMVSNPVDIVTLDVAREMTLLRDATADLARDGKVELVEMERADLATLQRLLRRDEFHILHFIGHGGFDTQADDGVLVLEDSAQRARMVSGGHLGTLLHDHRTLRLAILNACEGARTSRDDPFSGVAQSLVQQGLPAVIAMQFEITDEAAMVFGHEFYLAVSDGYPVDAALSEARKALFAAGSQAEWATPVLYLRAPDGRLFDVAAPARPAVPVVVREATPTEQPAAAVAADISAPATERRPTPPERERVRADTAHEEERVVPAQPVEQLEERRPPRPGPSVRVLAPAAIGIAAVVIVGFLAFRPGGTPGTSPSAPVASSSSASESVAPRSTSPSGSVGPAPAWLSVPQTQYTEVIKAPGVASHLGEIWVAGGELKDDDLAEVWSFDPTTERWTSRPALPAPINHAALVSDGSRLYLIGGQIRGQRVVQVLDSVYRLEDPDGLWQKVAGLPLPRTSGAAAWDGDRIVFAGGIPSTSIAERRPGSEVWGFANEHWSRIDRLSVPREHLAAASDGQGTVWFLGGADRQQGLVFTDVDVVRGGEAEADGALALARQGPGAAWTAKTGPCAFGGATDVQSQEWVRAVQCLGSGGSEHVALPRLPVARYAAGIAAQGNDIYVVGGYANIEPADMVQRITVP